MSFVSDTLGTKSSFDDEVCSGKEKKLLPKKGRVSMAAAMLCLRPRRPAAASNAWTDTAAVGNFMGQYCGVFLIFTLSDLKKS